MLTLVSAAAKRYVNPMTAMCSFIGFLLLLVAKLLLLSLFLLPVFINYCPYIPQQSLPLLKIQRAFGVYTVLRIYGVLAIK